MASKRAKKQWDQTMAASGIVSRVNIKKRKRTSGRAVKISKAMRIVDRETRKHLLNSRLNALEADNYEEQDQQNDDEEFFVEDEESKETRPGRKSKANEGKIFPKRVKSLQQIVFEEYGEYDEAVRGEPNYLSCSIKPSRIPGRKFCSVCGFFAAHTCVRCGSKLCSVRCYDHHRESGCLKFH